MQKSCFCNFILAGMSLTEFGLIVPSPFTSLDITNDEISSMTSWKLVCTVGGDSERKINIAAFEALLYSAAQTASGYADSSGIPVSFAYGWLDSSGNVSEYASYQGFTLTFQVSTTGLYMVYTLTGYASRAVQSSMPVIHVPAMTGFVQPSAVFEGLAKAVKADRYYELDVDHDDAPTLVSHGAMTTSFNQYVKGNQYGVDDYVDFPGLTKLATSYNGSRDAAGLKPGSGKLSTLVNNLKVTPVSNFLKKSLTDNSPQCASYTYWVDEPTMTQPGVMHFKNNANLVNSRVNDVLEYGTANTNILSLQGSYNGVAYNMTDMSYASVGFTLDGSGNTIVQDAKVVNSWSNSLATVFQTVNIINDVNALASQFSGDFNVTIPGSVKYYGIAKPISLLVMTGNTVSPVTGIYNIVSVSHKISNSFVTTLKIQRLKMSSANQVASSSGIIIAGKNKYPANSFNQTPNVKSTHKVDFGTIYPTFEHMGVAP